jgi:hypothetical protein
VYSPYENVDSNPAGSSGGGSKPTWGPDGGGSTFNITNNNNINYNYGSNITAISSEGSVPTFQDLEKKKSEAPGTFGAIGSALSGVANSEYV